MEDSPWMERAKVGVSMVNRVNVSSLIVVAGVIVGIAIAFQRIPSPFVTAREFDEHQRETRSMIPVLERQTEVLGEMKGAIQGIRCDQKPTNAERLHCFQNLR